MTRKFVVRCFISAILTFFDSDSSSSDSSNNIKKCHICSEIVCV